GVAPLQVVCTDPFGQSERANFSVKRGDVVIAWDQTTIEAIRNDRVTLGLTTRTLAMVTAAMYDAVNDITRLYSVYKVDGPAPRSASIAAAAAEAAYTVLLGIYPGQKALFDATLAESLMTIPDNKPRAEGLAVGLLVGKGMLALRANDGSDIDVPP